MSFSPGAWRLSDDGRDIHDSTGRYIAYLSDLESDADARLIAAAPEMYELLKSLAGGPNGELWVVIRTKARALLARIDGEPPK